MNQPRFKQLLLKIRSGVSLFLAATVEISAVFNWIHLDVVQAEAIEATATAKVRQQIDELQSRVDRARNRGDRVGETLLLRSLGNAYTCLNDFNSAISAYQKASTLVIGQEQALTLSELGHTLFKMGKVREAEKTLRDAIAQQSSGSPACDVSTFKQYPLPRDWAGFTLIGEHE